MNLENFDKMTIPELATYREAAKQVADRLGDALTNYATTNRDIEFRNLSPELQLKANKRVKIVNIIDKLDNIIENKVLTLFD